MTTLNMDSDNEGRRTWRQGDTCNDSYDLPSGFNPIETTGTLLCFGFIAAITDTYLSHRRLPGSNVFSVQIWGAPDACRAAKVKLTELAADPSVLAGERVFSKVKADRGWEIEHQIHTQLAKEAKLQKYRRNLHENDLAVRKAKFVLALPWPEESQPLIEDILGQQLEAIDDIRMAGRCYIKFMRPASGSAFLLVGNYHDLMEKALARLQTIPYRHISHNLHPIQLFLFKPISIPYPLDYSAYKVQHVAYFRPNYRSVPNHPVVDVEPVSGYSLKLLPTGINESTFLNEANASKIDVSTILDDQSEEAEPATWLGLKHAAHINSLYMRIWITVALRNLVYYSGHIRMELALGTCLIPGIRSGIDDDNAIDIKAIEDSILKANSDSKVLDAFMPAE